MSKASTGRRQRGAGHAATKPYWEMDSAQLQRATAEFDREFVGETFGQPTPTQRKQLARAKHKRGRPRMGEGTQVISVSIEKGLLRAIDDMAKRRKAKRAELISAGLRAVLDGRVPIASK